MKNNTLSIKAIGVTISTFAPLPPGAPKTCSDTWCIAVEECRDRPHTGPDACQSRVGHQACLAGVDRSLWRTPWLPPEVERVSCTRSVQRASSLIACSSASTLSRATTEVGTSPPAAGRIPGRPAWQPGRSRPAAPRYAPGTGTATGWGGLLKVGMCGRTYRGYQPRACAWLAPLVLLLSLRGVRRQPHPRATREHRGHACGQPLPIHPQHLAPDVPPGALGQLV